jgi:hypothetical protein
MDSTLMSLLAAAGLAGASGHRAFVPAFLLGVMHHLGPVFQQADGSPFFALSPGYAWLAHPVVMVVLGGLMVLEYLAEANPDVPELTEWALRAPKLVSGFIVVAALVGAIDDSTVLMATSGLLGAGTALAVDGVRSEIKHVVNDSVGEATDGKGTKALAVAETGWSAGMTVAAIVVPIVILAAGVALFVAWRGRKAIGEAARVPCPSCGQPRHRDATACPHCKAAIA